MKMGLLLYSKTLLGNLLNIQVYNIKLSCYEVVDINSTLLC